MTQALQLVVLPRPVLCKRCLNRWHLQFVRSLKLPILRLRRLYDVARVACLAQFRLAAELRVENGVVDPVVTIDPRCILR